MKKTLAWLLTLVLLAGMLPSAFAEESGHTAEKREYNEESNYSILHRN